MKKFKKVMAMSCAAIMAVSAMSVSAFAADYAQTPKMASLKLSGFTALSETTRETVTGELPNGLKYTVRPMTEEEKINLNSGVSTYSFSWTGNVTVPISNGDGTNGAQLGYDFIIAPDTIAVISVGALPQTTMPTINVGASATNGMWTDWIPGVEGNSIVTLEPGTNYTNYSYRVKVSTSEAYSRTARFSIETQ